MNIMASKGQASSMYTLLGVLLVSVFALFLFVTQSGNQAENLETLIVADVSFNSETTLRNLYSQSVPLPDGKEMSMTKAITYGCSYGNASEGHSFSLSKQEKTIVNTEEFLENYLNKSLGSNYRFTVECNQTNSITVGEEIPENPDNIVSSTAEIPLPQENKTEAMLQRW